MKRLPFPQAMSTLTGIARTFGQDELIVSKTDLKGHTTNVNDVCLRLAGYTENQVIGAPHCLIRHPHMPHGVFRLLCNRLSGGNRRETNWGREYL
ncbi:MAG: hypothetical protein AB7E81_03320 [Hyphomicrobiaceae bacterium]